MLDYLKIADSCTGCSACANCCPKHAILLTYNEEGFYFPQINASACIDCGLCEKVCQINNKGTKSTENLKSFYLQIKDSSVLSASSSGGAFSAISNIILGDGGVIFAARYNYDQECLEHACTDQYPLDEFRKSKYIESYIGQTYSQVKDYLKIGRKVFFIGTPCQIIGLKKYLGQMANDENLLTVDLICHGVPSNKHFTDYKHYLEKKNSSRIKYFDFRNKKAGWHYLLLLLFESNKKKYVGYNDSYYFDAFNKNKLLRKSCYTCDAIDHSVSDITIGDFWGINKYKPDYNGNDGLSVLVAHTERGVNTIERLRCNSFVEEIPLSAIEYIYQNRANDPKYDLVMREKFANSVKKDGYMRAVKVDYWKKMYKYRIKSIIKKTLNI